MDEAEAALHAQLPAALRQLHPPQLQAIHQHSRTLAHHGHGLGGQLPTDLPVLDPTDPGAFPQPLTGGDLTDHSNGHHHQLQQAANAFEQQQQQQQQQQHHQQPLRPLGVSPRTPARNASAGGLFGILTPAPALLSHNLNHDPLGQLQQEPDALQTPDRSSGKGAGHIENLKLVPHPPNLDEWREKLFDVNDTITLTEEEFQVYFPHVDNIYSHRSTQRYKRKPFISHYWDCRLKGRPPGTPKSDDPSKKKRKRTARQRDLCDVKIKITEYLSGSALPPDFVSSDPNPMNAANPNNFFAPGQPGGPPLHSTSDFDMMTGNGAFPLGNSPGAVSQRYFTIQRVNGNGGNGKGDGVAGPHKHTLADSDRVKKNSVQRWMMKEEKEKKKTQSADITMANKVDDEQKTYHKRATGPALTTVKKHSKDADMVLYGSCFCPFVQRVWISLEAKGIPYQYVEVDPYKKPDSLLQLNPRGLVPALKHGDWSCYESTVLLEYLEDSDTSTALLPLNDPQSRAHCRLWSDHINRHIVPGFYHTLQAQDLAKQIEHAEQLKTDISKLVDVADHTGPFFLGASLSFVDVQFAPWMLRLSRVLKPYRGWPDPEAGSRWCRWLEAIEKHPSVKATTSSEDLYLDSYERYAENRKNTSQLANAVNAGRGLP